LRLKLQYLTGANPRETCHGLKNREVGKIEGLKNQDSTVVQIYLMQVKACIFPSEITPRYILEPTDIFF